MPPSTAKAQRTPASTDEPAYRGRHRSSRGQFALITVALPDDLLHAAGTGVLERRRDPKGFNRSALIEVALRHDQDERA